MGKSTTASLFRTFGVPFFDADLAVHDLMRPHGAAVAPIRQHFGNVANDAGGIDRGKLGAVVVGKPAELKALEAIVHPIVRQAERHFLQRCQRNGDRLALLDIPLLFETGGERRCDATAVVTAPAWLQRARVLRRPGMTAAKLDAILERQMPDRQKRKRATFLVRTGSGLDRARADVSRIVRELLHQPGGAWPHHWLQRAAR